MGRSQLISLFILCASILAIGLAWAAYFDLKDVYEKEPRRLLLIVFVSGMISTGPAFLMFRAAEYLGFGIAMAYADDWMVRLAYFVFVGALIEELCKFMSVQVLIRRHPDFDEPLDGIIYAAFGALGFASMENFVLGRWLDGPELWGRLLASPLTHALFAAVWGWALSLDRFARPQHPLRVFFGLLLAILTHGVYNFFVLSSWQGRIFAAGLILVLWIIFFRTVSHALKISPHRPLA